MEESPIRVEHIIDHYLRIRSRFPIKSNEPLGDKGSLVDKVKIAERIVLHTLCFDLAVNHPYANFRKAFIFMKGE